MKRHHPSPHTAIEISNQIHGQLCHASIKTLFEKEDWEIAAIAIQEWMARNHPDALAAADNGGYQWKDVFLPTGTLLRTVLAGRNHHCMIEGDHPVYEGKSVSPNGFISAVGGMRRSAWRNIWVLLPGSVTWVSAEGLRRCPRRIKKWAPVPVVGKRLA